MSTAYDANENLIDYYGVVQKIVEYKFGGPKLLKVVFFECDWFDPRNGTRVDKYGMVEVKHNTKLQGHNNAILASQAEQVYYLSYPHRSLQAWWVAFKVNPQLFPPGDAAYMPSTIEDGLDVFQEDGQVDDDVVDVQEAFEVSDAEGLREISAGDDEEVDVAGFDEEVFAEVESDGSDEEMWEEVGSEEVAVPTAAEATQKRKHGTRQSERIKERDRVNAEQLRSIQEAINRQLVEEADSDADDF